MFVLGQTEIPRMFHLDVFQRVGIGDDAVAGKGAGQFGTSVGLAVVGMLEQYANHLHSQPFLQFLVRHAGAEVSMNLYHAFTHSYGAFHTVVHLHYVVSTACSVESLFPDKPKHEDS